MELTSTQQLKDGVYVERCVSANGEELVRQVPLPTSHVRWVPRGAATVYAVTTTLLRVLVRTLYLFPILLVAKVVLYLLGIWQGDLITVAFVVLVVALFSVFALVLLLMAILGPRSARRKNGRLAFAAPRERDIERLISDVAPTPALRVVGRIDAGLEAGAPVLTEQWSERTEGLVRRVEGSSFILFPDEGMPVAAVLKGCPIVLTHYQGGGCVLRQGDRIELTAAAASQGIHLEDARLDGILRAVSGADPYREGESLVMIATSIPGEPLVLQTLDFSDPKSARARPALPAPPA